jgi:hypothetical protein
MSVNTFNSRNSSTTNRNNGNPFQEDDDDYSFGNRQKNGTNVINYENELKQHKQRIGQIENESLESTYRALRSINETTEIGVKTAAV